MSPETFALLERMHGHLAVLGLALLVHPLVSLRRRPGLSLRTRQTAELAALLLVVPTALGWWIYPAYRTLVKPDLIAHDLGRALLFESKEHLALACVALVVGGALTLRLAGRRADARAAAWWLLATGWLCGAITAGLGIWVAAGTTPGG